MDTSAVTILVPTYNRAHFLAECLDSVLGQTIPPAQVIVINDGSRDNTREVLAPYMDRIEYIEKENGGKSAALNVGLNLVKGDYVWIVDDDDVAFPDAVERLVAPLERNRGIGFSYSGYVISTTRRQDNRIEPQREVEVPDWPRGEIFIRLMEANFIRCPLVRSACYREVGPYREDLVRSQDYEMALRLARRFYGARANGMTSYYRQHAGRRGTAANRFSEADNREKWREYDQRIFRQLRGELELSDYLPAELRVQPLGPSERRRAYLKRMAVMIGKGIFDDMLCDLGQAIAQTGVDSPLTHPERTCLSRAMCQLWPKDRLLCDPEFAKSVRILCRGQIGRDLTVEMARGLYWRATDAVRAQQYGLSAKMVLGAWRLLGLRGINAALVCKLKESLGPYSLRPTLNQDHNVKN
ncbi:MAG TPA: glycosyltransferase family A protein [Terriglobia bacterium]|nr:glycosyltransferase family A protein [Terriglobia bacterium]